MISRFFIGIGRHIRDAFRNFFRNFGLSLSALASINVTLIVVSLAILLGYNFNSFTSKVESDVEVIAYIVDDLSDKEVKSIEKDLKNDERVQSITFSSKEEELAKVVDTLDGFGNIAGQYEGEENPLHRVFYLKAKDVDDIPKLTEEMKATNNYIDVKYGASVVEKVTKLFDFARILTMIIIALLLLVTVFIIYNTIRITIYTRSVQVEIMKLIGASNYHIVMPYIYEGILIGVFGSILPILITTAGYNFFYREYADNQFIKTYFELANPYPIVYFIAAGILIVGVVVGVFGSALSIRRFVRKQG